MKDNPFQVKDEKNTLTTWIELITPKTAKVLAYYDHPYWGKYAAVTQNSYGKGAATYIGCLPSSDVIEKILEDALKKANLWGVNQEISFPLITKTGVNEAGNHIHYYFNYSSNSSSFEYPYKAGVNLLTDKTINSSDILELAPWEFIIVEVKN